MSHYNQLMSLPVGSNTSGPLQEDDTAFLSMQSCSQPSMQLDVSSNKSDGVADLPSSSDEKLTPRCGDEDDFLEDYYRREIARLKGLLEVLELGHMTSERKETRVPPQGVLEDLITAILDVDLDLVSRLIKGSWNLNVLGKKGLAPLHAAAMTGNKEICRSIIRLGAQLDFTDANGMTASNIAAGAGKLSEFNQAATEEFLYAASRNDEDTLRRLVEEGWNVNTTDIHGLTALHKAAGQGYKFICKLLIENGAYIDAKDVENETPLEKANAKGQHGVIDFLLTKGAELPEGWLQESSPKKKEELKVPSPFHKTMNRLASLVFGDKQRREKIRTGHHRLLESGDIEQSATQTERGCHPGPSTPEPRKKPLSVVPGAFRDVQKASTPLPTFSQSLHESYDDYQCNDCEHHLWGQFLDPGRRRISTIKKNSLENSNGI